MDTIILEESAKRLVMPPKGLLAIDESIKTCSERLEAVGIEPTEENRRAYRELLITAPEIEKYISGFILFDETIKERDATGKAFTDILKSKGVDIGIKVDIGTEDLPLHPGEKITLGLDNLRLRLKEYKALGATFAKWRAVITVAQGLPSDADLIANANELSLYAGLCQEENIVPIIEPEVMMTGSHSLEKCFEVSAKSLDTLFSELATQGIYIPGVILKTNMIVSGSESPIHASTDEITKATLKCFQDHVPKNIGGIVFLSGGQTVEDATINLNNMHTHGELPWPLTFSYGRAIQNPALKYWAEHREDRDQAQKILLEECRNNSLASIGKYKA